MSVDIPIELHHQLLNYCVHCNQSIKEVIRRAIVAELERLEASGA